MVSDQLLVTGQVSNCIGEGGVPVHPLAGYLVEKVVTQTTDRYLGNWCTWVQSWVGIQGDMPYT